MYAVSSPTRGRELQNGKERYQGTAVRKMHIRKYIIYTNYIIYYVTKQIEIKHLWEKDHLYRTKLLLSDLCSCD